MTETWRMKGDPRLGFIRNELEGEECVECDVPAEVAEETTDGIVHYCERHFDEAHD